MKKFYSLFFLVNLLICHTCIAAASVVADSDISKFATRFNAVLAEIPFAAQQMQERINHPMVLPQDFLGTNCCYYYSLKPGSVIRIRSPLSLGSLTPANPESGLVTVVTTTTWIPGNVENP